MTNKLNMFDAAAPKGIKLSELIDVSDLRSDHNTRNNNHKGPEQSRAPSPNRGASVPDFRAVGPDCTAKSTWRQSRGIDCSTQVKITKLSHMRYQHPDLDEITSFLKGMICEILLYLHLTATRFWNAYREEMR